MTDAELKRKVEALLFSSGRRLALEEIARACRAQAGQAREALEELRSGYEGKDSSLMLLEDAGGWKFTVREEFAPIARKVTAQTELPKSVVETLAVVAWKAPVLQSDIIKIRTNKAYDHLSLLEDSGFLSRKRYSRTQMINLTQKFHDYFDLAPDAVKAKFGKLKPRVEVYQEQKPAGLSSGALEVYQSDKPAEGAGEEAQGTGGAKAVQEAESPSGKPLEENAEENVVAGSGEAVVEAIEEPQQAEETQQPEITPDMSLKDQLAALDSAKKARKGRKKASENAPAEMP